MINGIVGDPIVYLNGEFLPISEAKISVLDRGFIFGDGIYEVVPVYQKKPFRMSHHLNRLFRSLDKISLPNPYSMQEWEALVAKLIGTMDEPDQFVYIQVTRGVAKRDHPFPAQVVPTVFAMTSKFNRPTAQTRHNGVIAITGDDKRWLHCDIKSISLLGNVLARQEAVEQGALEILMFRDGYLTEGSSSNIWVAKDNVLYAPPKDNLILEGIRYGLVEEICAAHGIEFKVKKISLAEVLDADELMVSSATKEVLPVVELDKKVVGSGVCGPLCARIQAAYDQAVLASQ